MMVRYTVHIARLALLICFLLTSCSEVLAGEIAGHVEHRRHAVSQYDRFPPLVSEEQQPSQLIGHRHVQRVGNSRNARLTPTHGPKPGRNIFREGDVLHSIMSGCRISCLLVPLKWGCMAFSLPRFYYVIALRRILC